MNINNNNNIVTMNEIQEELLARNTLVPTSVASQTSDISITSGLTCIFSVKEELSSVASQTSEISITSGLTGIFSVEEELSSVASQTSEISITSAPTGISVEEELSSVASQTSEISLTSALTGISVEEELSSVARSILYSTEENRIYSLPFTEDGRGGTVLDRDIIRNLNNTLDQSTIRSILESVASGNSQPELMKIILRSLSSSELQNIYDILTQNFNVENDTYSSIFNILLYVGVGLSDINQTLQCLDCLTSDITTPPSPLGTSIEEITAEVGRRIDTEIQESNQENSARREHYNNARNRF